MFKTWTRDVKWISETAHLQMAQPLLLLCIVTNTHQPHDALFKFCFSDAVRAAEEFRAILPPNLVRKIDWSALERIEGSFVDETLTQLHSDLLFSTKINGSPGLIYLLFEHQSHAEPLMPYRMLRYERHKHAPVVR